VTSGFFIESDTLSGLFVAGGAGLVGMVRAELESLAPQIEEDAQSSAPWADRTGLARASLSAEVVDNGDEVGITLSHGVDYGYWLEVINNGEFAVIMPTLERWAPAVFDATNAVPTGGDF
jgi:hypothetical protein